MSDLESVYSTAVTSSSLHVSCELSNAGFDACDT